MEGSQTLNGEEEWAGSLQVSLDHPQTAQEVMVAHGTQYRQGEAPRGEIGQEKLCEGAGQGNQTES